MVDISSLITSEKTTVIEYPNNPKFEITFQFLPRQELTKLAEKCSTKKYDRGSNSWKTEMNTDMFLKNYCTQVIKGWSGLTLGYLATLIPIDVSA